MSDMIREPQYFCIKSLEGKRVEGVHVNPLGINLLICCFGGETVNESGEGSRVDFTSGFVARELFPRGSRGKKMEKRKKERKKEFFSRGKNGDSGAKYRLLAISPTTQASVTV